MQTVENRHVFYKVLDKCERKDCFSPIYCICSSQYVCFLASGATTTLMRKKLIISCLRREAIKSLALTVNKTDGVIITFAVKGIGFLFFLTEFLSNEAGSFQTKIYNFGN
jgi:hypothetical protein